MSLRPKSWFASVVTTINIPRAYSFTFTSFGVRFMVQSLRYIWPDRESQIGLTYTICCTKDCVIMLVYKRRMCIFFFR